MEILDFMTGSYGYSLDAFLKVNWDGYEDLKTKVLKALKLDDRSMMMKMNQLLEDLCIEKEN